VIEFLGVGMQLDKVRDELLMEDIWSRMNMSSSAMKKIIFKGEITEREDGFLDPEVRLHLTAEHGRMLSGRIRRLLSTRWTRDQAELSAVFKVRNVWSMIHDAYMSI
jgi:hypothetical protein